jgi:acyl-CoA synthetase (AMP-forming)/AMP-acid ligase II
MTDRLHSFTLGDVVRDNARSLPGTVAVVCGDVRLTYPELDERTDRVATLLSQHGVGVGDRVVWIGLNCHRLLELLLACAKLGAIATPVNWRLTAAEYRGIVEDTKPSAVLTSAAEEFAEVNEATRTIAPDAAWIVHDGPAYEANLAALDPSDPEQDTDDELPVLQIMTAGFAGRPKGALLTSRGIVTQDLVLAGVGIVEPGEEIYLSAGPMFHIGVLLKTFGILHWGGTNVIIPRVDAEEICRLVDQERCTSAYVFPPTMRQMVEANEEGRFDLTSLRDTVGGVPPEDLAERWYAMTSCTPPEQRGAVGYGTSETVGMVTFEGRPPRGVGPFGRTSPAVSLRIVDPEGQEVAAGEIGEIALRGPQVMAGYLDHEPLDPDGWRHTGDLGRREADGTITFLGPNQDMIKSAMENIYPVEVENAIRPHDAVKDACVIGVPDPEWGQTVRAVVELAPGAQRPSEADLIEFTRSRIASYKKPRSVVFVDELPRANGFIDRGAVKRSHSEQISW